MKRIHITIVKNLFLVLILPLHGVQKKTAQITTALIALGSTAASYKGWLLVKDTVHPAVCGTLNMLVASCAYSYLYSLTPEGRLRKANKILDQLTEHSLAKRSFDSDRLFFDAVHDVYLTYDLPLISAYNHLINLLPNIQKAFDLIDQALSETHNNKNLKKKGNNAQLRTNILFNNISAAIKRIREHKDYLSQLKIYKEFLVDEKQTIGQEQIIYAHIQITQSQQNPTLLKRLKTLFCFGK
jgi:hypothetical protein